MPGGPLQALRRRVVEVLEYGGLLGPRKRFGSGPATELQHICPHHEWGCIHGLSDLQDRRALQNISGPDLLHLQGYPMTGVIEYDSTIAQLTESVGNAFNDFVLAQGSIPILATWPVLHGADQKMEVAVTEADGDEVVERSSPSRRRRSTEVSLTDIVASSVHAYVS